MELVITEQDKYTATLRRNYEKWGETAQLDMVIEEAAEVIQAINKWKRFRDDKALGELHVEVADLQIMLDQLYLNFLSVEEVKIYYRKKIERLEKFL